MHDMGTTQGGRCPEESTELATLAGGCFWCLEAVFRDVNGVRRVVCGYAGGTTANPSYEHVCTGRTGHAEAVQITYDPQKVPFRQILDIFFSVHNPTTLNRQGADAGTQYRSAIFYHSEEQRMAAEHYIRELEVNRVWDDPIVTEVTALQKFYPAEEHHQEYFRRHPEEAYCRALIAPKLVKFRASHARTLKPGLQHNGAG